MISMNWVKDYVNIDDVDLKDLALKVTKAGVNVEKVITNNLKNLVIGEVIECVMHPDSDHLHVCKVNVGKEIIQIVCGAPNVRTGLKVIVALPGCVLPDGEIKKGVIRGQESNGMLCALYELGIVEKTEELYKKGIEELDNDAKVGEDPIKYLGLDDTIYDLDLNPNRMIDCTNHIGFAYEVASVLGRKVNMPSLETNPVTDVVSTDLDIETENCTMYNLKEVRNLKVGPSPKFMVERLEAAGMRSINNIVDISNYVMLEYGQPLHFFDKDKVGDQILVRMAENGEKLTVLDKSELELTTDDIVITDGNKPICLAGVMGGLNSGVDENTTNIIIESAIFESMHIRHTSLKFNLRSEASLRYEKGLNSDYCEQAIERACHLLEKYAGGEVLTGTICHDTTDRSEKVAKVKVSDVNKFLGINMTLENCLESLKKLGFKYTVDGEEMTVTIPARRLDVEANKADLIEEIGRLYGYDNIKAELPIIPDKKGEYVGSVKVRKQLSKRLRALGLNETRTYLLQSEEDSKLFNYDFKEKIKLLKPMSSDKEYVRQSLIPANLKVVDYNNARGVKDVCIYEIANTYYDEMTEETKICVVMKGNYLINNWNQTKIKCDFYVIKGICEDILNYFGLKNRYEFTVAELNDMHPGMSAEVIVNNVKVGFIGRVHPSVRKDEVYVLELSLNKLMDFNVRSIKHKEPSIYPSISKDLSFVMKKDVESKIIKSQIKKSGTRLLTNVSEFDVYIGENVKDDEKSIAYNLTFNDPTRTLNDNEINEIIDRIVKDVEEKCNATLRR